MSEVVNFNAFSSELASASVSIRPSPLASAEAVGGPSENCAEMRRIAEPRCAQHTRPPPLRYDFQVGDRSGDLFHVHAVARHVPLRVRHCSPSGTLLLVRHVCNLSSRWKKKCLLLPVWLGRSWSSPGLLLPW